MEQEEKEVRCWSKRRRREPKLNRRLVLQIRK
jgi:hypothetical protein